MPKNSVSDNCESDDCLPRPRGSNPKSPGKLPSSHGGGVLPGNHRGLSGSATAHTVVLDRAPTGAVKLLPFSFLPLRKEAFVVPKSDPFFELHAIPLFFKTC